jgi:predicted transcriptional regulator/ribosomal protein S18 acetylase RimI-like enzyme
VERRRTKRHADGFLGASIVPRRSRHKEQVGILIRPYRGADRRAVMRLLASLPTLYPGAEPWLRRRLADAEAGDASVSLACVGARVVGVLIDTAKPARSRKLSTLWVSPRYRRRGIASALLRWHELGWQASRVDTAYCTVPLLRESGALAFLLRAGFIVEAIAPQRYVADRDDAILVWKSKRSRTLSLPPRNLLISIHQLYAEAIFAGAKPYEIRRRRPQIAPGTVCWVYVPHPVRRVIGRFIAGAVTQFDLSDERSLDLMAMGSSAAAITNYLEGLDTGWSIEIVEPFRLARQVPLPRNLPPPQMYQGLDRSSPPAARLLARLSSLAETPQRPNGEASLGLDLVANV